MQKGIEDLRDHYIICGYGRMGKIVSARVLEEGSRFIIIESKEGKISDLREEGRILCIGGDAAEEEVLIAAGIKKAKALAALLPADSDNLYLVLTARQLNPSIYILSKVVMEEAEKKSFRWALTESSAPTPSAGSKSPRA